MIHELWESEERKLLLEARERGTCVMYWLSAVATWKLEMISNKVANLVKDISRQNAESVNWLILAACDKAFQERDELKKKLFNFQAEFR